MHKAVKAYGAVAKETANPRELEANLLLKAAAQLQSIKDDWSRAPESLEAALLYNRKLWTVFLTSMVDDTNPLPTEVRQNIANLGIFVLKRTLDAQSDPRPEQLTALISINRELALGLREAA